jgi:UDPglucose 6-dehydrogenase
VKVCVVGLGKLGLPLAALLAINDIKVVGYDFNKSLVSELSLGEYKSGEPQLLEYLQKAKDIEFTSTPNASMSTCEVFFFIVPTPSDETGFFSNALLIESIRNISSSLISAAKSHKIVLDIVSTVMPGSCAGEITSEIVKATDLIPGEDFEICYNPEFVALGSVIHDMEHPDMHLIGSNNSTAGEIIGDLLQRISKKRVPKVLLTLEEAELVKLAINNFVTMKISFANGLMQISQKIGNADIEKVTNAIGLDTRIGSKYLTGAMPYGGPCFPRDTRALASLYRKFRITNEISSAVESVNDSHIKFIASSILAKLNNQEKRVGVVGISYKSGTTVLEDSPAIRICDFLMKHGIEILYWDDEGAIYPPRDQNTPQRCSSLEQLASNTGLVFLARQTKFKLSADTFRKFKNLEIFDPWSLLKKKN